jgi:hypothetical protein
LILGKDDLVSQVSLLKRGEFFAEGRYLPLRGEDFQLRGDDFPLRGDDFPVRGEDFPQSAKNQSYVRFPWNFAWWSPWTCLTKKKYKNRLLIDFKQRRPCISGISAKGWEFFAEGRYLLLRGKDFLLTGDDFLLQGDDFPVRGEDFPRNAKNQRYVWFPRNFAWWSPWTCLTKKKYKNRLLIDVKKKTPCISGISAEGWELFAEGRYVPLRGEDFLLRGDDFLMRGDDFPVRGEDFPQSTKNQRYVRFPRNFAWWSPWTCLTEKKCKNRLLIDFKQRRPCISSISAEGWELFAEGRYLLLRGEDFVLRGDDFLLRGDDFPVRGEDFLLSAENQHYVRFPRNFAWWSPWTCLIKEKWKTGYWLILGKDDLVSQVSLLRGENYLLRGDIYHWGGRIFCWGGMIFRYKGMIFRWGGRIFRGEPKINAMSHSHETLHGDPHGHV